MTSLEVPTSPAAAKPQRLEHGTCVVRNTVVLTVVTGASFLENAAALAASAKGHATFPCIRVAFAEPLTTSDVAAASPLLEPLLLREHSWRPPHAACAENQSGYRKTSVLKTHALSLLLSLSLDVYVIDSDWRFRADPMPWVRLANVDIIAPLAATTTLLNIGLAWLRSTGATRLIARRVANRSVVAWDQGVFNEELKARLATMLKGRCCYNNAWAEHGPHRCFVSLQSVHLLRHNRKHEAFTAINGQGCHGKFEQVPEVHAVPPVPAASAGTVHAYDGWSREIFNPISFEWKHLNHGWRPCPAS